MELPGGGGHEQGLAGREHVAAQVALQQHLSLEAEEGAGSAAGDAVAGAEGAGRIGERGQRQLEVVDGRVVGDRRRVLPLGRDAQRRRGLHAHALQHLVGVDLLGGQARAQHVVAGGHDLQAHTVQVGVQGAGGHEHRLARAEGDGVQQQRGDHAGVARVVLREQRDGLIDAGGGRVARLGAGPAGLDDLMDRLGVRAHRGGDEGAERGAHAVGGGAAGEEGVEAVGEIGAEPLQERGGAARGAEPAQRGEAGQRDEHLGLVVVVAVVALRRLEREPGRGLRGEGLLGVLAIGVDLQGQRLLRCDDLQQVGQAGAKGALHAVAEHAARVRGDRGVEPGAGVLSGGEGGGRQRVRPVPGLGPGGAVGGTTQELGDRGRRSPVVVLDAAIELPHVRSPFPSRPCVLLRS